MLHLFCPSLLNQMVSTHACGWKGWPPGARFDDKQRTITFTPDFIQGGNSWKVTIHASNESGQASKSFEIEVLDTISPPLPIISETVSETGYQKLTVKQTTDSYLDSKGLAGRTFDARVYVPDGASATNRMPVRGYLHGHGGALHNGKVWGDQFYIYPHDHETRIGGVMATDYLTANPRRYRTTRSVECCVLSRRFSARIPVPIRSGCAWEEVPRETS